MRLHSDNTLHFNQTCPHLTTGTGGPQPVLRLMPSPSPVQSEGLRHESPDQKYILKQGAYTICLADSFAQRKEAKALIKRMYSWRGYNIEDTAVFSHSQTSFEAYNEQDLIGTLTLGLDSKKGLLAEELYRQEIDNFRERGRKLCELSKLAIDPLYSSKELLASLFNLAYICGRIIHKATDFIIEINPRHAGYYRRVLGFDQIGEVRTCQRVNAPAVLLHLDLDYVDVQVSRLAGLREQGERSLYSHFLTKSEEKKVAEKIWRRLSRLAEQPVLSRSNSPLRVAALCS